MPITQILDGPMHYETRGTGDPLLLIMGLGGRGADWTDNFLDRIARRFTCITFDNRGTGQSERARHTITLQSMANDAAGLLDHLGFAEARVAGISMGGMIAQRFALAFPARVKKLALLCTHCGGAQAVSAQPEVLALIRDPKPGIDFLKKSLEAYTAPGFALRHPLALMEAMKTIVARPTPYKVFQAQIGAIVADARYDELPNIKAPTLVVTGDSDRLVPPQNSTILANRIPGARLEVIRQCGHMIPLERPAELAELLTNFL